MAIQLQGNGGTVAEVEAAYRSMHVTIYPQDPLTLGYYALSVQNGTTAMAAGLAAAAPIVAYRWGNANLALIRSLKMSMVGSATAFTAGRGAMDLFFARSFTFSDTGGTTATITT